MEERPDTLGPRRHPALNRRGRAEEGERQPPDGSGRGGAIGGSLDGAGRRSSTGCLPDRLPDSALGRQVDGLLWDDDYRFPAADATAGADDEDDGAGLLRCKQLAILTAILVALLTATIGLLLGGKDDAGGDAPFLRGREWGRGPGVSNGPAASTVGPAGRGWAGRTYADAREFCVSRNLRLCSYAPPE